MRLWAERNQSWESLPTQPLSSRRFPSQTPTYTVDHEIRFTALLSVTVLSSLVLLYAGEGIHVGRVAAVLRTFGALVIWILDRQESHQAGPKNALNRSLRRACVMECHHETVNERTFSGNIGTNRRR